MAVPAEMDTFAQSGEPIMDWAFTQSPFAQAIHDKGLLCLGVNDRMCRLFGLAGEELRGRRLTEVLHGPQYDAMEHYMRQVLDTGEPTHRETYRRVPGEARERAWSISVSPLKDGGGRTWAVLIGVLDITLQYWARQRLTLLDEAGTRIGTTLDVTRTAQELADMMVPRFADMAIVDLLDAVLSGSEPAPGPLTGTVVMRRVAHQSVFAGVPEAVIKPGAIDIHPESFPSARCLATGKAILTSVDDPAFISSIGHNRARAETVGKFGIHSSLSVPIRARGVSLGVVVLLRGQRPEPFEQEDMLLAEDLTARAALSLDNARRYTRERTAALALQRSLLPHRLPRQSAVEVASRYLPASAHAGVGGDWFDVIPLSGARVALVVGDVIGHDIHASATMGRLRTAVRTLADVDLPPDELLTRLDDLVNRISAETDADGDDDADRDVAATCVYAVYDPVSRLCCLARAGHPMPALVTPDGTVSFLDVPASPPLGLGGLPFESTEVELPAGSMLVLYTDGLIESRDRDIDLGFDRLRQALTRREASLDTACDNVLAAVLPDRPADDVALLIARTHVLNKDQVATWDLPADPVVVASARRQVATRLAGWGLDDATFIAELVVSELITNAIRHARSPIQLRLIRDRTLICEVSDGSSTAPHLRQARALDEGGRGLLLVSQLSQRWGSRQTAQGKTIWAEVTVPGQASASLTRAEDGRADGCQEFRLCRTAGTGPRYTISVEIWRCAMPELPTGIDTSRPHPARTYDYFLGGKDNFAADREVADKVLAGWPAIRLGVRENRKFLKRAVRYLAGEAGIRQFLDIGTGLPTAENVHEVAQAVAPSARVVYVDNDPLVLAHARALLTSSPEGRTAYIHADLRDPAAILNDPVTRDVLDFTQPVALMLVAILHMIPDEEKPAEIVAALRDALPPGSYLVASHITAQHSEGAAAAEHRFNEANLSARWRDADVFARLAFAGLDLVPPGVVLTSEWRNDEPGPRPTPAEISAYCGVARRP